MTTTKWTAGPWHIERRNNKCFPGVSIGGSKFTQENQIIVNSCLPNADLDVHWANAQLIALSPEWPEVLRSLLDSYAAYVLPRELNCSAAANARALLARLPK